MTVRIAFTVMATLYLVFAIAAEFRWAHLRRGWRWDDVVFSGMALACLAYLVVT